MRCTVAFWPAVALGADRLSAVPGIAGRRGAMHGKIHQRTNPRVLTVGQFDRPALATNCSRPAQDDHATTPAPVNRHGRGLVTDQSVMITVTAT